MQRLLLAALAVGLVGFISAETFARFHLGLGTPPLSVADPDIEYMFRPSQDVQRFGNRQLYNAYGMRSSPIPDEKPEGEFRMLALGDSVLNGGNLTDHADLATTMLSREGMRVLHASAGSWGPPNMLAYVEKFGLFEADLLVVVLSSHDARDIPSFAPLDPATHPTRSPLLALTEGAFRYLPRYFPDLSTPAPTPASDDASVSRDAFDPSAVKAIEALADQPIPTCIVLHPERSEFETGNWKDGRDLILAAAGDARIVEEMSFIRSSADYRDNIHLSADGQEALADAIADCRQ